jgi:hypothetical protein
VGDPIVVWAWEDTPEEIRGAFDDHDDMDWVAFVPPQYFDRDIGWMREGSSFGCCSVRDYPHPHEPGYVIRVGYHA